MLNREKFKLVKGYEDYLVSTRGRVYSFKSNRFLTGATSSTDYIVVRLTKERKTKTFDLHRLVAKHFLPYYFPGAHVNHIDFNRQNNSLSNLEWLSQYDNNKHSEEHRNKAIINSKSKYYKITYPNAIVTGKLLFCLLKSI